MIDGNKRKRDNINRKDIPSLSRKRTIAIFSLVKISQTVNQIFRFPTEIKRTSGDNSLYFIFMLNNNLSYTKKRKKKLTFCVCLLSSPAYLFFFCVV